MSYIYLVTEYVYGEEGKVLGSEPIAAFPSEDEALDFMDTHTLGDEVVEVSWQPSSIKKFAQFPQVVYSGNADAAAEKLTEFFNGRRGKKR